MNKKMYAVNWHRVGDVFSHCTVTTITVTREGVLPGCTGVTITATDHEGRKFQGSPDNYHDTEAKAWAEVKVAMSETIRANESSIAKLVNETNALREYLTKVGAGETAMSETENEIVRLRSALTELTAIVRGECGSLLDEDRGGSASLSMEIDDLLGHNV